MIGAGLRCTAYCQTCCVSKDVDLQAVASRLGLSGSLWNRRARCRITEGCPGYARFFYDDARGRPREMWDF